MAHRNEPLGPETSLVWVTQLPFKGKPRRSCPFSLMGSEWYLEFAYENPNYYHVLSLHPANVVEDGTRQVVFQARTHISNPKALDHEKINVMNATVLVGVTTLWWSGSTTEKIFKLLPSLYDSGEIRFVCRFQGKPQSTIHLEIETESIRTEDKSVQASPEVPRDIESLSSDLSHLLDKEILPDASLECGGRTFRAHRSVLGARSRVFRAMFQDGTLESETGVVKIQDVDVDVLEKLLKFLYAGKPEDISEGNAADLYRAADKYEVLSLTSACAYWIERHLTVENCVQYLRVSDSHWDRDLKAAVVKFITGNPSVMKGESWFALSKELPALANEVLQTYVSSIVP